MTEFARNTERYLIPLAATNAIIISEFSFYKIRTKKNYLPLRFVVVRSHGDIAVISYCKAQSDANHIADKTKYKHQKGKKTIIKTHELNGLFIYGINTFEFYNANTEMQFDQFYD